MGNVSAKFCRCHVFCVSGRFRFQCRQGNSNSNNDNENSEDNVERQFINLTCDFRFFSLCLSLLLTYFKSGLSWNYAHGGMRWQGVSWGSACMSDSWVGYAKAIKKASDLTLSRRRLRSAERGGSWPWRGNKTECSVWKLSKTNKKCS